MPEKEVNMNTGVNVLVSASWKNVKRYSLFLMKVEETIKFWTDWIL